MPRQRDPRIVNPASHPQKWVNFTVAGEYLDGMDRRAVSDYVTEGQLKAEWKGRRRKVHIDELVRFKAQWLMARAVIPVKREGSWATTADLSGAGVYFLKCEAFIKIGCAKNVARRIDNLRTGLPFHIRVISLLVPTNGGTIEALEHGFHRRFRDLHVVREWFRDEGALGEFCASLEGPSR